MTLSDERRNDRPILDSTRFEQHANSCRNDAKKRQTFFIEKPSSFLLLCLTGLTSLEIEQR